MAEVTKYQIVPNNTIISDVRTHQFSLFRTIRRSSTAFVYGVVLVFVVFTIFLALSPSSSSPSSSPWFISFFTVNSSSPPTLSEESYRSHFSSIFSYIFPNSSETNTQIPPDLDVHRTQISETNISRSQNVTVSEVPISNNSLPSPESHVAPEKSENFEQKQSVIAPQIAPSSVPASKNSTKTLVKTVNYPSNSSRSQIDTKSQVPTSGNSTKALFQSVKVGNFTQICSNETCNSTKEEETVKEKTEFADSLSGKAKKGDDLIYSLVNCDLYDGNWVRDESYPLYKTESCSFLDEQFRCILNGRTDTDFQKLKWKPKGCSLPRFNGKDMLERLRGKRLVFVGDSLNRNMWESLVCILKNSVKNESNVYEAFGRQHFKGGASYSFVFKDYDCTIEFFVAPFLVQEWEVKGKEVQETKETLRLDIVVKDSDQFKDADFLIFNTGHWWTHDKTSKGEDYYQEGSHVYKQLDVDEAFRKAMTTWGRWVDSNVNPRKTHVLFRGYSVSHFSGGQWNSGGSCSNETKPIENDSYLMPYPWKMSVLEKVIKGMKTKVSYLNVTKLTDYRKDGHPSIYRKHNSFDLQVQDCSHWCLPGVPDSWNELLYAELLRKKF